MKNNLKNLITLIFYFFYNAYLWSYLKVLDLVLSIKIILGLEIRHSVKIRDPLNEGFYSFILECLFVISNIRVGVYKISGFLSSIFSGIYGLFRLFIYSLNRLFYYSMSTSFNNFWHWLLIGYVHGYTGNIWSYKGNKFIGNTSINDSYLLQILIYLGSIQKSFDKLYFKFFKFFDSNKFFIKLFNFMTNYHPVSQSVYKIRFFENIYNYFFVYFSSLKNFISIILSFLFWVIDLPYLLVNFFHLTTLKYYFFSFCQDNILQKYNNPSRQLYDKLMNIWSRHLEPMKLNFDTQVEFHSIFTSNSSHPLNLERSLFYFDDNLLFLYVYFFKTLPSSYLYILVFWIIIFYIFSLFFYIFLLFIENLFVIQSYNFKNLLRYWLSFFIYYIFYVIFFPYVFITALIYHISSIVILLTASIIILVYRSLNLLEILVQLIINTYTFILWFTTSFLQFPFTLILFSSLNFFIERVSFSIRAFITTLYLFYLGIARIIFYTLDFILNFIFFPFYYDFFLLKVIFVEMFVKIFTKLPYFIRITLHIFFTYIKTPFILLLSFFSLPFIYPFFELFGPYYIELIHKILFHPYLSALLLQTPGGTSNSNYAFIAFDDYQQIPNRLFIFLFYYWFGLPWCIGMLFYFNRDSFKKYGPLIVTYLILFLWFYPILLSAVDSAVLNALDPQYEDWLEQTELSEAYKQLLEKSSIPETEYEELRELEEAYKRKMDSSWGDKFPISDKYADTETDYFEEFYQRLKERIEEKRSSKE